MGGEINWAALPVLLEMFGIADADTERILLQLITLRDREK